MSFLTCRCDLPQKLQRSCSFPSLARAIPSPFTPNRPKRLVLGCGFRPSRGIAVGDHGVDNSVLDGFYGAEEEVTFHVVRDLLLRLAGVLRVDLLQAALEADHLAGL